MLRCLFLISFCGILWSCSEKVPETKILDVPTLRASQLYDDDDVRKYMEENGDKNAEIAKAYEDLATDAAINNPSKYLYYLKRIVSLHPNYDTYVRLAGALADAKKYEEAVKIYQLLSSKVRIQGEEYKYLFKETNQQDEYDRQVITFLAYPNFYTIQEAFESLAKEDRASFKDKWLGDERIRKEGDSTVQKMIVRVYNYLNKQENEADKFNDLCKVIIKDSSTQFSIGPNEVLKFDYVPFQYEMGDGEDEDKNLFTYRSFLLEAKEKENFWSYFNFNRIVPISDSIVAIHYSVDTSTTACPKEMRHIYHRLATYTKQGKLIDTKVVAWQAGEQYALMQYTDGKMTITESKRTWKNPYRKSDFDNYLLKKEELGAKTFQIQKDGYITEITSL